jgi:hypothetical protein
MLRRRAVKFTSGPCHVQDSIQCLALLSFGALTLEDRDPTLHLGEPNFGEWKPDSFIDDVSCKFNNDFSCVKWALCCKTQTRNSSQKSIHAFDNQQTNTKLTYMQNIRIKVRRRQNMTASRQNSDRITEIAGESSDCNTSYCKALSASKKYLGCPELWQKQKQEETILIVC